MKLSIYTCVKNGIYYDFHVVEMLKHHIPLADEIVVNEGFSSDRTYEAIKNLNTKVRIVRNHWDQSEPKSWLRKAKDQARRLCTGDWCILLDCDEFIPEWEFERLRAYLTHTDKHILRTVYKHFYGNYRVMYENPDRPFPPKQKWIIHRNRDDIAVYGDGSDVQMAQGDTDAQDRDVAFECHHFGEVRHASRLRQKWRSQAKQDIKNRWSWAPGFLFDWWPHRWFDKALLKDLKIYEGPYIEAVRNNPTEFVRDDLALYHFLAKRNATAMRDQEC